MTSLAKLHAVVAKMPPHEEVSRRERDAMLNSPIWDEEYDEEPDPPCRSNDGRPCEPCACSGMATDPHCQMCCQSLSPRAEAQWRAEFERRRAEWA